MTLFHDVAAAIVQVAPRHSLDPQLVRAVVRVESGGDTWAWNPEPRWRYFWDVRAAAPFRRITPAEIAAKAPPPDFAALAGDPDQEWWAQQASWGVMQVMGAVAREFGCRDRYLSALCEPVRGVEYGCRVLAARLAWAKGDVTSALAAYNGGPTADNAPSATRKRNAAYAAKVLRALDEIRAA